MFTLKLNTFARIQLTELLGVQRGSVENLETYRDIRAKVRVSKEALEKYIVSTPMGTVVLRSANETIDDEIEFEKAEAKKLVALLRSWESFTTDDLDWVIPVKKQLDSV